MKIQRPLLCFNNLNVFVGICIYVYFIGKIFTIIGTFKVGCKLKYIACFAAEFILSSEHHPDAFIFAVYCFGFKYTELLAFIKFRFIKQSCRNSCGFSAKFILNRFNIKLRKHCKTQNRNQNNCENRREFRYFSEFSNTKRNSQTDHG